jgi:hypothetical protein
VKYSRCKTTGHWWDDYVPPQSEWRDAKIHAATAHVEFRRCVGECGMTRMFQLAADGSVLSRSYHPPPDYAWDRSLGDKPSRAEMRVQRILERGSRRGRVRVVR